MTNLILQAWRSSEFLLDTHFFFVEVDWAWSNCDLPGGTHWGILAWPAICDIWLGKRTVPVLAVAKEVAALQHWPRDRDLGELRTDRRRTAEKLFVWSFVSYLFFMFFFPSRSNNRLGLLIECSKLTYFAREKAMWFLGEEIDGRRGLLSGVLAGRRASWKRGK